MRSCLCRWTSQLRQSRERPGCSTLRRTFCGRSLAGVKRGGPRCSSQLPGAGRLGLPGPDPLPPLSGRIRHVESSPPPPPIFLASASLRNEPFSSSWPVTWLFDHRENTLISDSRPRFPSLPKISRKTGKQSSTYPIFTIRSPSLSLLYRYFGFQFPKSIHFLPNLLWSLPFSTFFSPPLFPLLSPPSHVPDSPHSGKLRSLPSLPLPRQVSDSTGAAGPSPAARLNPCPPTVRSSSAHLSIKAKCKLPAERRGSEPFLGPLRGSTNLCLPDLTRSR